MIALTAFFASCAPKEISLTFVETTDTHGRYDEFANDAHLIRQMKAGIAEEDKHKVLSITNRGEAIRTAVALAKPGDIILLAGKGHENYQEIKGVKNHFDDKEALSQAFKEAE